jgi:hypothetical protein
MGWWSGRRRATRGQARARRDAAGVGIDEIGVELARRGVPEPFVAPLARRAAATGLEGDRVRLEAMLDGIAIAFELQKSTQEQLTRSLRGLREVERMMGAFSGELSKLDEVLGVLAAYVRRMRSSGAGAPGRTLH